MAIKMTEQAAAHIKRQVEKNANGVGLRLGVKKGGCTGFAYTVEIAETVLETDRAYEEYGAKVLVSEPDLVYLDGTELDYVQEGLGKVFKFNNPNVKDQCGCGESFSV